MTNLFALALIALSGLLIQHHLHAPGQGERSTPPGPNMAPPTDRYRRRQTSRRVVASGCIGLVGFALLLWPALPRRPLVVACYLLLLTLVTAAMIILAILDIRATRRYFSAAKSAARDELARELRLAAPHPHAPSRSPEEATSGHPTRR